VRLPVRSLHTDMRNILGQDVHSHLSWSTQPGHRSVRRQNWGVGFVLTNIASARCARYAVTEYCAGLLHPAQSVEWRSVHDTSELSAHSLSVNRCSLLVL
jgi:hypothetical protein